mgnify:CR=1 FL=1
MLNEHAFIIERINYCCQRLHSSPQVREGAMRLLDKIELMKPELIIRKNPNVVAAQIVCLVARAQNNKNVTHTTLSEIMNTSAPSVGKYKHYLEPWVRTNRLMQGLRMGIKLN